MKIIRRFHRKKSRFRRSRQNRSPKRNRNSFSFLKKSPKGKRKLNFHTISDKINNVLNIDENANLESANSLTNESHNKEMKPFLIDWTLKTRIRFVSNKAFGFRGNFRANEESAGISGFVRCLNNRMSPHFRIK